MPLLALLQKKIILGCFTFIDHKIEQQKLFNLNPPTKGILCWLSSDGLISLICTVPWILFGGIILEWYHNNLSNVFLPAFQNLAKLVLPSRIQKFFWPNKDTNVFWGLFWNKILIDPLEGCWVSSAGKELWRG